MIVGERAGIFENVSLKTHSPQVIFTGRLENQQLLNLYREAHAFVSPSVYEGFGLPPLEAMACGCPCVISDIPSHREICGVAPTYVPADSVDHWVDALREAAGWSPAERERRKQLGLSYCPSVFLDEDRGKDSGNFEFLPRLVFCCFQCDSC